MLVPIYWHYCSLVSRQGCSLLFFSDYINPIDLCNRLNTYIIPEAAVHVFLTFLFLINGYWLPLILNLPLVAWNAKKYAPENPSYVRLHVALIKCACSGLWKTPIFSTRRRFSESLTSTKRCDCSDVPE